MDDWGKLKARVKAKRLKKNEKNITKPSLKGNELTVQRLSSEVSGKAQKYTRIGPREFVPIPQDSVSISDLTLEDIKSACEKHFSHSLTGANFQCDVLAGEQGPSCKSVEQIPDLRVIHIRFIDRGDLSLDSGQIKRRRFHDLTSPNIDEGNLTSTTRSVQQAVSVINPGPSSSTNSVFYPRSLSLTEMLKLGKVNPTASTAIEIHKFDLDHFYWSKVPTTVEFFEEENPFSSGGFRKAFKATSKHPDFQKSTWVIKRYLPEALKAIHDMDMTAEMHTRKVVQMHLLARNFASKLEEQLKANNQQEIFGETFVYQNIFFGVTDTKECVTIEEYIPGEFMKYTNNTGLLCVDTANVYGQKAECLAHYSYEKSEHKLLLVDIQGSRYQCFDPEIASADLYCQSGIDKEILYCTGNLSLMAITNFTQTHNCKKFCAILGLAKMTSG